MLLLNAVERFCASYRYLPKVPTKYLQAQYITRATLHSCYCSLLTDACIARFLLSKSIKSRYCHKDNSYFFFFSPRVEELDLNIPQRRNGSVLWSRGFTKRTVSFFFCGPSFRRAWHAHVELGIFSSESTIFLLIGILIPVLILMFTVAFQVRLHRIHRRFLHICHVPFSEDAARPYKR